MKGFFYPAFNEFYRKAFGGTPGNPFTRTK